MMTTEPPGTTLTYKGEHAGLSGGRSKIYDVQIVPPGTKHYGLGSCQVASITNGDSWTHGCGQVTLFPFCPHFSARGRTYVSEPMDLNRQNTGARPRRWA